MMESGVRYEWICGTNTTTDLLEQMSFLFGNHYGIWSQLSPVRPGERIRQSANQIRKQLQTEHDWVPLARHHTELLGYAIASMIEVAGHGRLVWVAQLVVHEEYRNRGIANQLLNSIWGFSDDFAWGVGICKPLRSSCIGESHTQTCGTYPSE